MTATQKKILLLLLGGLALGFSYSPRRQWKTVKGVAREWKRIDEQELRKEIKKLYRSHLVSIKENPDKTTTLFLTDKGKIKALTYRFETMRINKSNWDGKWRLVVFDIPEKLKSGRDALRMKLKELGFHELQKSVFVFPYECRDEIEFVIEFFDLRPYVRYGLLESIDNDPHLKNIFKLG